MYIYNMGMRAGDEKRLNERRRRERDNRIIQVSWEGRQRKGEAKRGIGVQSNSRMSLKIELFHYVFLRAGTMHDSMNRESIQNPNFSVYRTTI